MSATAPIATSVNAAAPASQASSLPASAATSSSANPFVWLKNLINRLIDSAAGYDEKILEQYGTATDEKRRRNIGRAILVATAVGALGWFTKILMAFPLALGLPVAIVLSFLYAVLSYSLESFFASNVDPYAPIWSKALSLTGRTLLSCVIAFSGALPWITMALSSSIQLEMNKMAMAELAGMRKGLDDTYGLANIQAKAGALQGEAANWATAAASLPPLIQKSLDEAQACATKTERMGQDVDQQTRAANARLAVLSRLEGAENATDGTRRAVATERARINASQGKSSRELAAARADCAAKTQSATTARDAHLTFTASESMASQKRLADLRRDEGEVDAKLRVERAKIDQVVKETSQANSSAEFSALLSIVKTQLYAQVLAGLIFLGLLLVDVLPLTLRLFSRPGPYDAEKRTDDAIKAMRADGRLMEAAMMHEARRREMQSKELQDLVQAECRPHIRSIALNGVNAFLKKQAQARTATPGASATPATIGEAT